MTRDELIDKNKYLFWYIPDEQKHSVSDSLLVETLLNEGSLDDYRDLVAVMGKDNVAKVFFSLKGRQKANYYPEIYHFFTLVLSSHA